MTQPDSWKDRAQLLETADSEGQTITAYCLQPIDLAYNKLEAGREKDYVFILSLIKNGIITLVELENFIRENSLEDTQEILANNLSLLKARISSDS